MKDFNERPFKKDTPVIPFSNGSDFDSWQSKNCLRCVNYEAVSTKIEDSKCKMAFLLDISRVGVHFELWAAKEIGCDYNPLYGTVKLFNQCKSFSDGEELF